MAIATQVSIEEYLKASYHPDRDFVDNHVEERTSGETPHSNLQVIFASYVHLEILSDCDTIRFIERMADYYHGVQNLWILNPVSLEAWVWQPKAVQPTTTLVIPGKRVVLPADDGIV